MLVDWHGSIHAMTPDFGHTSPRRVQISKLAPILLEMATLGQDGLPVNDSEKKFTLRSLPGDFTALNIVCIIHVGMKMIDSNSGSGLDIDREYEAASSMRAEKR